MYTHQTHTTGQTNVSLLHCQPINQWTTTKGIGMRMKLPIEPPIPTLPEFCGRTVTILFPLDYVWIVPRHVTSVNVECYGPGGSGGSGDVSDDDNGGSGGGGGGYGASNLSVIPGDVYTITVPNAGNVVFSGPAGTVSADVGSDGLGGAGFSKAGGDGGGASGDIAFTGGKGGSFEFSGGDLGGGGGGGAGPGGNGGAGNDFAVGGPGNGGFAGGGGAGSISGAGFSGNNYGGGGGGGLYLISVDEPDNPGGLGGRGLVLVTYASTYGLHGDIHQTHTTGQTNYSIQHCTPINQYTTTKGISMRRKYLFPPEPSDLRITQQYAEVFNVDPAPSSPKIRTTQFYVEVMEAPPGPTKFTAPKTRRMNLRAAGLSQPTPPPEPFAAPKFLKQVAIGAALAASLPAPTPPSPPCNCTCVTTCNVCAKSGACPPPTITYGSWSGMSP
jgi:hypothetical protein